MTREFAELARLCHLIFIGMIPASSSNASGNSGNRWNPGLGHKRRRKPAIFHFFPFDAVAIQPMFCSPMRTKFVQNGTGVFRWWNRGRQLEFRALTQSAYGAPQFPRKVP
jgi:hypothetical protein